MIKTATENQNADENRCLLRREREEFFPYQILAEGTLRLDVSEEKTEPVKAEAPVKAPVEDTEVSDDRMSEIDRLLKELEDKK